MSIEAKLDGLIAALDRQTAAIQHSALVMASLIEGANVTAAPTKRTRTKKDEPVVAGPAIEAPVAAEPVAAPVTVEDVVATMEPLPPSRALTAEELRQEVIKIVGSLKTKLDERKYAEFTAKLKGEVYSSFKTVNGAVKCLDDTNVMDDTERGDFLTAVEKLVAEYV